MSDSINTPNPIEFQFGDLGSIVAVPSLTKNKNWFFAGSPSVDGERVLLDLGNDEPLKVLANLPEISVNGVVLRAKQAPHLSQKTDRSAGGNPTVTHSGSITIGEGAEAKSYTLMANVTFLKATEKRVAGYTVNCKAIPQSERQARPARGTHTGFAIAK